jgi:hypothetical protein
MHKFYQVVSILGLLTALIIAGLLGGLIYMLSTPQDEVETSNTVPTTQLIVVTATPVAYLSENQPMISEEVEYLDHINDYIHGVEVSLNTAINNGVLSYDAFRRGMTGLRFSYKKFEAVTPPAEYSEFHQKFLAAEYPCYEAADFIVKSGVNSVTLPQSQERLAACLDSKIEFNNYLQRVLDQLN